MDNLHRGKLFCFIAIGLLSGCDLHHRPKLSKSEAQVCLSRGGHESRAPFGTPICQIPYADAGKACSGGANCQGRCLSDAPDHPQSVAIGMPVAGRCEAESSTFGCHARVENGKLAEEYICED
jgi:hypothetical protein